MALARRESDEFLDDGPIPDFDDGYEDQQIYKCPNCSSKNSGYLEKEASLLTFIAAIISLIIFKIYAVLILPLIIESTKTTIKKCIKCDHILDKHELMSMPSLNDNILKFSCGNCAVVISRKYALVIVAILIIIWFFLPSHQEIVNPGGLFLPDARWEAFVADCGRKILFSNEFRAKRNFDAKYNGNIIDWTGVVQAKIDRRRIQDPQVSDVVLIKMNPSDSKEEYSDLQLSILQRDAKKFSTIVAEAEPGDVIRFKAVFRKMGTEFHYHNLEVIDLTETDDYVELSQIPMLEYEASPDSNLRKAQNQLPEGKGAESKKKEEKKNNTTTNS